jgi:hypothetical protein
MGKKVAKPREYVGLGSPFIFPTGSTP